MRRREFVKLMATAAGAATLSGCTPRSSQEHASKHSSAPRMLVVAFDGLDPRLVKSLMAAGRLPNFKRLAERGSLNNLATTTPPHTPVAFSTVITGTDPTKHGVFDFIHRDPNPVDSPLPVRPFLSTAEAIPPDDAWRISLGNWEVPLAAGEMRLLRQGRPFWESLTEAGIDTDVYFFPANFPCSAASGPGRLRAISGMGTPDLLGTHGEFTFYSSHLKQPLRQVSGGRFVKLSLAQHRAEIELWGPVNWQSAVKNGHEPDRMTAKLNIKRDPASDIVLLELGRSEILLNAGQWSEWLPVDFEMNLPGAGLLSKLGSPTIARGMVRVFLKSVHPALEVYVSPVNLDPLDPAMPISEPAEFARELAVRHGRFYTLGIPEDTKAFTHGALDADAFVSQAAQAAGERLKLWRAALTDFEAGCLCFYFGASDLMQHMFWRDYDDEHPAHDDEAAARHGPVVPQQYFQADARVGEALAMLRERDTLIVFSDHGFTSFRQGFNLNSWLVEQGYLRLDDPSGRNTHAASDAQTMFAGVDWGYSQAYGLGMNGLYLNQQGREKFGCVQAADSQALCEKLSEELLQVRDEGGKPVFDRIDRTAELYPGANPLLAPDLILGYADGFRASWETVLGGMPATTLVTNREQWSGEHLISARLVPGVLLSNRKLTATDPHLRDLAPTVLRLFGIEPSAAMTGKPLVNV